MYDVNPSSEPYKNAHPKVMALLLALNVKLIPPRLDVRLSVEGEYDSAPDTIWARDVRQPYGNLDSYLLHELVHWTGHISRLKRFYPTSSTMVEVPHGRATEEYVAQYGMVILAEALGIIPEARDYFRYYLSYLIGPDHEVGRDLAHKAVGYIKMLAPEFFGQVEQLERVA